MRTIPQTANPQVTMASSGYITDVATRLAQLNEGRRLWSAMPATVMKLSPMEQKLIRAAYDEQLDAERKKLRSMLEAAAVRDRLEVVKP